MRRSPQSFAFLLVHGIQIRDGKMNGGADPGGDGMAMMVETMTDSKSSERTAFIESAADDPINQSQAYTHLA